MTASAPERSLRRILIVSAIDGWSIAVFAGLCTLVSLLFGEWLGVLIGGFITGAGVFELRGRTRLVRGDASGLSFMIRAQALILGIIWVYAFRLLLSFDQAALMAEMTPEMRDYLAMSGIAIADVEVLIKPVYYGFYLAVMALTLVFQGGLAAYYLSQKKRVLEALAARAPSVPPPRPSA